jgi:PIN domain nuclease of toxin-antitoxin system
MNILLDTHTFIWFIEGSSELSLTAKKNIEDVKNTSFISIASLWEMSIKFNLGKLTVKDNPFNVLINDINENGFQILDINFPHLMENVNLDSHHRDPFDRLIVAQAISENMNIIGKDVVFDSYLKDKMIKRIW